MPEIKTKEFDPEALKDLLPIYYKRIFPHKPFYRWMSYGLCKLKVYYDLLTHFINYCALYVYS